MLIGPVGGADKVVGEQGSRALKFVAFVCFCEELL